MLLDICPATTVQRDNCKGGKASYFCLCDLKTAQAPRPAQVFCDLGTDCADCGPWKHRGPAGGNASAAPVQALVARGVEVHVARTKTVPSFIMPYTNPKHDVDVSGQMAANGQVELGITQARGPPKIW